MEAVINELVQAYIRELGNYEYKCQLNFINNSSQGKVLESNDVNAVSELFWQTYPDEIDAVLDNVPTQKNEAGIRPYGLKITFTQDGKYEYQFFYPTFTVQDIKPDEKDELGCYPNHVYINITSELIDHLDTRNLNYMIPTHIEAARRILNFASDVEYTKSISDEFYLMMINVRVVGDIEFDGFNGLYEQFGEYSVEIFLDIYKSFEVLRSPEWLELFGSTIQIFAHHYDFVEEARKKLGLSAIPKQDNYDIRDRFYSMPPIEPLRADFISNNRDKFLKTLIKV